MAFVILYVDTPLRLLRAAVGVINSIPAVNTPISSIDQVSQSWRCRPGKGLLA